MNFTGRMALENRVLVQSEGNDMDFYKIIYQNAGDMDTSSEADNITMTNWTFCNIGYAPHFHTAIFCGDIFQKNCHIRINGAASCQGIIRDRKTFHHIRRLI